MIGSRSLHRAFGKRSPPLGARAGPRPEQTSRHSQARRLLRHTKGKLGSTSVFAQARPVRSLAFGDPGRDAAFSEGVACRRLSYARSARSFLGRDLPCSTSGKSSVMSLRFAAIKITARAVPRPSQITWCLEPGRRRSTGEGPVFSPPLWPAYASCPRSPGTSPVAPRLATRPAALGAGAPRPPLRSSPAAAASTSCPTHTPSLVADPPTGCPFQHAQDAPSACRSGTRLRPGYRYRRSTSGNNGSIRAHNPSLTSG